MRTAEKEDHLRSLFHPSLWEKKKKSHFFVQITKKKKGTKNIFPISILKRQKIFDLCVVLLSSIRDLNLFLCGRLFQLIQIEYFSIRNLILTSKILLAARTTVSLTWCCLIPSPTCSTVRNGNTRSSVLLEWTVMCDGIILMLIHSTIINMNPSRRALCCAFSSCVSVCVCVWPY